MKSGRTRTSRWRILRALLGVAGLGLVVLLFLVWTPLSHLVGTWLSDQPLDEELPPGFVDDASRQNRTSVAQIVHVPADRDKAERELAELLQKAAAARLQVSIAGARHTMGGHTIAPDGIVIDMQPFNRVELDPDTHVLHAQAGARWDQIIPYLDRRGRSIEVMQSNNSFTVGGSISANCHGWQARRPPIASTVLAMRVMLADGSILRCSREENRELFSLVLGGYGLLGIILDVDLRTVPNERYVLERFVTDSDGFLEVFRDQVAARDDARMAYGRLCIAKAGFFREASLNVLRSAPPDQTPLPGITEVSMADMKRTVFRGCVGSDYGKQLRWDLECTFAEVTEELVTRNQLLSEGVELYQDRSAATTDILHEYFIPPEALGSFVDRAREIIPRHQGDLLNATIRHVLADNDAFLRYADGEMFALVLLFSQKRSEDADQRMAAMTRELIDAALESGGRYYLPYRLHATREQFERAYPQAGRFFELKRKHDPNEMFQNRFWQAYAAPAESR